MPNVARGPTSIERETVHDHWDGAEQAVEMDGSSSVSSACSGPGEDAWTAAELRKVRPTRKNSYSYN